MRLLWEDRAWDDYLYWQTQDKKVLKRVNLLIKDIRRNPFDGVGKPEPLKNNLSGWWYGWNIYFGCSLTALYFDRLIMPPNFHD